MGNHDSYSDMFKVQSRSGKISLPLLVSERLSSKR